jgi:hypothetical protein
MPEEQVAGERHEVVEIDDVARPEGREVAVQQVLIPAGEVELL